MHTQIPSNKALSSTDLLIRPTRALLSLFRTQVGLPYKSIGAKTKAAIKPDRLVLLLVTDAREKVAALVKSITSTGVYVSALTDVYTPNTLPPMTVLEPGKTG
ncbi:hypothetical protein FRB97_006758 [Tulasnella sp. 331]|nr:hypothetical protein FRB97_006758 [Tulasnella sp. 331]KAG8888702.1 hypothetical protein FRB98_006959 [Tulasnella sp. 332]